MKKTTKKYIEKTNIKPQNPNPPIKYSYTFIKQFVQQSKIQPSLQIQFPKKYIYKENNSFIRQKKVNPNQYNIPLRQMADEKTIIFKKHLSEKSENGGWLSLSRIQSKQENKIIVNELKFNLNIITPNNFDSIAEAINLLVGEDQKKIISLVEILISKSQFEAKYHPIYSKLCGYIIKTYNCRELKMEINKQLQQSLLFIQKAVCDDKKLRKQFFNKIIFFSELFLSDVIYRQIFDRLIKNYLKSFLGKNKAQYLQALLILFDKIGKWQISHPNEQQKKSLNLSLVLKNAKQLDKTKDLSFESIFNIFNQFKNSQQIDNRLRSLIKNLLEKRLNKWKDTLMQSQRPKTLEQIKLQSQVQIDRKQILPQIKKCQDPYIINTLEQQIIRQIKNMNLQNLKLLVLKDENIFTDCFIINFYQHKYDQIQKLIKFCHQLISIKKVLIQNLIHSLMMKLQLISLDEADFPFLKKGLVKLLMPFIRSKQFRMQELQQIASTEQQEQLVQSLRRQIEKYKEE